MQRQQQEENEDRQMITKLQDDVTKLQNNMKQQPPQTNEVPTCQICRKTKFAEGGGQTCHYCQLRCCARCGCRLQLKTETANIWCCLICKKKQELLFKGTQWQQSGSTDNLLHQQRGGRPSEERRHRAVVDNLDLEDQQDSRHQQREYVEMRRISEEPMMDRPLRDPHIDPYDQPRREGQRDDPNFYIPNESPIHAPDRYQDYGYDRDRRRMYEYGDERPPETEYRSGGANDYYNQGYQGERNYIYVSSPNSSYPEFFDRRPGFRRDLPYRSDDDRAWQNHNPYDEHPYHSDNPMSRPPQMPTADDIHPPVGANRRYLDPKLASRNARQRRFIESMRADSLSSDPSDTARPPPPRPRRAKRSNHFKQSVSSSEDDLRSTPDYTSEDLEEVRDYERGYSDRDPQREYYGEGHSSDASTSSSSRRRRLPQVPLEIQQSTRDKVTRELEEKTQQLKIRMQQGSYSADAEMYNRPPKQEQKRNVRIDENPVQSDFDADTPSAERSHRTLSEFKSQMEDRRKKPEKGIMIQSTQHMTPAQLKAEAAAANAAAHAARKKAARERQASLSDSAATAAATDKKMKRKPSLGKIGKVMGWKSGADDKKKGFQRSEEVGVTRTINRLESTDSSLGSVDSSADFSGFVEGLGPGQIVGRQVLGAACLGEIQLSLFDRKGRLDIEVVRARRLLCKPGAKVLPATYVKIYLVEGKRCVEKLRTSAVRNTLDPFYSQSLHFVEPYGGGRMVQATVWGDYGRMDKKVFMGVAQIELKKLSLSQIVIGWYKLFPSNSLTGGAQATLFNHSGSSSSIDGHASH